MSAMAVEASAGRMVGNEIVIHAPEYPRIAVTSIYGKKWIREA